MNRLDPARRKDTGFDNIMTGAEVRREIERERLDASLNEVRVVRARRKVATGGTV